MDRPDGSFFAALRAAVRLRDCLVLAVVPAFAVVAFALPVARRESLAFAYRDPSLVTAYTAQFVHFDIAHLAANVLGYVLVAGFGYALAALAGYRRLFGVAAVTYLLAFPPALSWLNLAIPRNAVGYGLSGLNMAFAGLLALVLVAYAGRLDDRVRVRHAPGLFFAVVALIALLAPRNGGVPGVGAASALVAVGYVVSARRWAAGRSRGGSVPLHRRAGWFDALVLGVVTLFGYQFVGFASLAIHDGIVNVYVHLLGFCLGFIVPYTALAAGVVDADRGFLSD
ncbi:hypothetical protein B4589_001680 [Halolamina sp. CBA1230]|uniref:hypothetical protein n=1 Tax=Halolamina sp. CBA1230 TaxID=1853690 RepID=UPI0009A19845|nr:hypothetical protein [Halolamina sp. CBA1230]QKY19148.1 hypothetical protein B4589_001680 [Halolamina sp. CBA1230]